MRSVPNDLSTQVKQYAVDHGMTYAGVLRVAMTALLDG
jgi:hypothetical protein